MGYPRLNLICGLIVRCPVARAIRNSVGVILLLVGRKSKLVQIVAANLQRQTELTHAPDDLEQIGGIFPNEKKQTKDNTGILHCVQDDDLMRQLSGWCR